MSTDAHLRQRAARLATTHLPPYLGQWIASTLTEPHTLPDRIEHQDKIAADILSLYADTEPEPPPATPPTAEPLNVEYPTSILTHAAGPDLTESGHPAPLCPARSRRWSTSPTTRPVNCQRCRRRLASDEAAAGLLTTQNGRCPACGGDAPLTLTGLLGHHEQANEPGTWCGGAGKQPTPLPRPQPEPDVSPPRSGRRNTAARSTSRGNPNP